MANTTKEKTPPPFTQATQEQIDVFDDTLNELNDLGDKSGNVEISGRIYRELSAANAAGRPLMEFVGTVDRLVDEDYIGRTFGGGRYKLRYTIKTAAGPRRRDVIYSIGSNYDKFVKRDTPPAMAPARPANEPQGILNSFLSSLSAEKITAFALALKTVKELFAPPPAPVQNNGPTWDKVLEFVAANNNRAQTSVSDAVVIKAMENMNAQARAASPLEQYKEFVKLQDALKGNETENPNEDSGQMQTLIQIALKVLPELLKKNNNDYRAAGAEAAAHPFVKNLIETDPGLAKVFFEKAVKKFGPQKANELAAGFGFQIGPAPAPVQMTAPPFYVDETDDAAAADPGEFDAAGEDEIQDNQEGV